MHLFIAAALLAVQASAAQPAQPPKAPDCSADVYRQFDFWVGDWDVVPNGRTPAPGQKPATNIITKDYGGCVVMEHWTAPGQTGSSFNIYDRTRGQWHQTWVDSGGGLHEYWGNLEGDKMVFYGSTPVPPNPELRMRVRLTLFHEGPDRVRQLSERLNADGTWSVNYDLIYTRQKP
ncbi:MAG: hypothetical protein AB7H88_15370 [Vicinamibacterales bacterium]